MAMGEQSKQTGERQEPNIIETSNRCDEMWYLLDVLCMGNGNGNRGLAKWLAAVQHRFSFRRFTATCSFFQFHIFLLLAALSFVLVRTYYEYEQEHDGIADEAAEGANAHVISLYVFLFTRFFLNASHQFV